MPKTCWAPGCKSGYPGILDTSKRHFFQDPVDSNQLQLCQKNVPPRVGILLPVHYLCDIHFEEHFILKKYFHIINGQTVETDRGRWNLSHDAIPTIFPSLPKYLTSRVTKPRQRKPRTSTGGAAAVRRLPKDPNAAKPDASSCSHAEALTGTCVSHSRKLHLQCDKYHWKRQTIRHLTKIKRLTKNIQKLEQENKALKRRLVDFESLPPKMKLIVNMRVATKVSNRNSHL